MSILYEHQFGDTTARYLADTDGHVGLWLYPTAAAAGLAHRRITVADESWVQERDLDRPAIVVEPLVRVKIVGDNYDRGHGQGRTLLWSPSNDRFHLLEQRVDEEAVVTVLGDDTGLRIEHRLSPGPELQTLLSETTFTNGSQQPVRLELLTSFSLSGITPFAPSDAPERIVVHRFRSIWSAEGRLVSDTLEHLHLERSWAGGMNYSERFGQIGSMPVRGWFPTALVEDTVAGVIWGAKLAHPTSWQMEVSRSFDDVILSGGIADREFGHWTKTIQPGDTFAAPQAWVTCVVGSIDDACDRLLSVDVPAVDAKPAVEQDLPIIYNDWCTSWGEPREEQLIAIADAIAPLGVKYLVIDAGWYMPVGAGANWAPTLGDWIPDQERFPKGLAATTAAIRERGLIPGIWFEPEHVGTASSAYEQTDHLLRRDGQPYSAGFRRAWDLHDPFVSDYLDERLIGQLRDADFGYLKLDYSETLGIGVDHPDGLGEGIRRHGEGTHALFQRIENALPGIVIEICSAGGHRMESSLLQRSSMSSFSDAHELLEIPIVAGALHRLMLPRQSQIWAVLHSSDSTQRMTYSLAATFLGRMCLSGDILDLSPAQFELVQSAADLYREAVPVIKNGTSRINGDIGASWRHPAGWQAVVRTTEGRGMVVVHSFADAPEQFTIQLPGEGWRITNTLGELSARISADQLAVTDCPEFAGQVFMIER